MNKNKKIANICCILNHIQYDSVHSHMKKQRTKTNSANTTLLSVWVSHELAETLKKEAAKRDLTKSQLIRRAIKSITQK